MKIRHHCQGRAAKFEPMLGPQDHRAGRNLFRAAPAVSWDFGFNQSHPRDRLVADPEISKGVGFRMGDPTP